MTSLQGRFGSLLMSWRFQALVEALYRSSERPGEPLLENDETFTVDD
jgi:hypothetical protein